MNANGPTANDNHNLDSTRNSAARAPRRGVTTAILGIGILTLLVVLGAARRSAGGTGPATTPVAPTLTPAPTPAPAEAPPPKPIAKAPVQRPQVELVFALDTTGSMSGLIEGAKQKIWSLASFVAQGQPTPDLRVGLIGYRDVGDAYVTKVFDLDGDMDRVYRRLQSFRADGGGDTPEHVARALDESVHKMSWSQSPAVVKVIYLVGDAPPHTDYHDGYDYQRAARAAKAKNIALHTILCGNDGDAETAWRRIALLGGGQYMAIRQDGGMHEEHTAYDDELGRLHDKLAGTAMGYGAAAPAVAAAAAVAEAAPAPIKAERAAYLAHKHRAVAGEGDLLDAVASKSVKLEDLKPAELPADLRGLSRADKEKLIATRQKDREEITRRIDELSKKRADELERKRAAAEKAGARGGFDDAAKKALRKSVKDNPLSGLSL